MSNKDHSEDRRHSAHATQVPTFERGQPQAESEADAASPGSSQPFYGTRMAPPMRVAGDRAPLDSRLPSLESVRELTRTRRINDSEMNRVLEQARNRTLSVDVAMPAKEGFATRPEQRRQRKSTRKADGRSTWNLRIKQRGVAGNISGVINTLPDDPDTATGLQSALTVDDSVPEYEVIDQLGAGNMGIVYRARQTSLNRDLAIKTLKPDSPNVDHDQAMFVSEAVVTAHLVHPNIIPIHDLGRTADGKLFYSMKQVTGTPWNDIIREMSLEDSLDVFLKLCDAVAYAHSRGVINRDLKPENVVVGDYGEVIVLDWGLAMTTDEFNSKDSVIVEFRGGAGTPVYMPPEMAEEDVSGVGPHSDIYLLGAILFEILEGFPPHLLRATWDIVDPEEQLNFVIQAVLENQIESNVRNEGELMEIARKAMSTHPEDRYSSVGELEEAIREYRITGRAEELMGQVELKGATSYAEYQSAVALYEEALRKWPNNRRALEGDRKARLAYAELAHQKGDIDLGLQVIPGDEDRRFHAVRKKLKRTRRTRNIVRGTWTILFVSALLLASFAFYQDQRIFHADQAVEKAKAEAGEVEQKAKDQVAAARIEVDKAGQRVLAADKREKEADRREKDADKEVAEARKDAQVERNKADAAESRAFLANLDAELASELAECESWLAEQVTAEADVSVQAADKREQEAEAAVKAADLAVYDAFKRQIDAKEDVGNYHDMAGLIESALGEAEKNPFIRKDAELLKKRLNEIQKQLPGNSTLLFDRNLNSAVFGTDGKTLLLRKAECLTVLRNADKADSGTTDSNHNLPLSDGAVVRHIAVANNGAAVSVVGRDLKQAWKWDGREYVRMNLKQPGSPGSLFQKCLFSPNGNHLYLIGRDKKITVEIYDLSGETAELRRSHQLFGDSPVESGAARDAVLLPDETGLIVASRDNNLRFFPVRWTNGQVTIPERGRNQDRRAIFPLFYGPRNLHPEALSLSLDGTRLAIIDSPQILVVPRVNRAPDAGVNGFPFAGPAESKLAAQIKCNYTGAVATVAFSKDNSRLVVAQKRYLQVWKFADSKWATDEIDGLYEGHSLAGHAKTIKAAGFSGASNERILSYAADDSVRTWNTANYGQIREGIHQLVERLVESGPGEFTVGADRHSGPQPSVEMARPATSARITLPPDLQSRYLLTGAPQTGRVRKLRQGLRVYSARFSSDSNRVIVGANDLAAHAFNSRTGDRTASMRDARDLFFEDARNNFLEGHFPEIVSILFLPPDGDLLLTADYFGSVSVWDAKRDQDGIGYEKSRLLPEDSSCEITVSRLGDWIVSGGVKNDGAEDIAKSKDSFFAYVWKTDDILKSATPAPYRILENEHPYRVTAAAFSPDGTQVVTAGRRGRFVLWDFEKNEVVATADNGHGADGVSGVFFASNTEIISAGFDGRVIRWTVRGSQLEGAEIEREKIPDFVIRLRPSHDGTRFITSDLTKDPESENYLLELNQWSSTSGWERKLPVSIQAESDDYGKAYRHDIAWSSDSSRVLYVHDGEMTELDSDTWKRRKVYRLSGMREIRAAFAPGTDGEPRIASFDGRFARMWHAGSGELIAEFRSHLPVVRADYSSDRRFVITASESIRVFEADEKSADHGRTVFRLTQKTAGPRPFDDICFSPLQDDYRFASIDIGGHLKLWNWTGDPDVGPPKMHDKPSEDPEKSLPLWAEEENVGVTNRLRWNSNGRILAAVQRGRLQAWRIEPGQLVKLQVNMPENARFVFNCLDFSSDGQLLAAGGVTYTDDDELQSAGMVWRIDGDTLQHVADINAQRRHSESAESTDSLRGITALAFDDVRNEVISAGADGSLVRWQTVDRAADGVSQLGYILEMTGRPGDDFTEPHEVSVTCVDVAADGTIVTADQDGEIRIWPAGR